MARNSARGPIVLFVAVAVVVVGWQIALWTLGGDDTAAPRKSNAVQADPAPRAESPAPIDVPAIPAQEAAPAVPADYLLQSNELMTLELSELRQDRPVILGLVLPVPSPSDEPLAVRVVDTSGRELRAQAVVQGPERASANLEIEPGWLVPGTYLVHLTTKERSALPLRRFPFEVR